MTKKQEVLAETEARDMRKQKKAWTGDNCESDWDQERTKSLQAKTANGSGQRQEGCDRSSSASSMMLNGIFIKA